MRSVVCPVTYTMEERYKELLKIHHEKFATTIEVERLYPILQGAQVLTTDDILEINKHHRSDEKVGKLLEIIQQKPHCPFQKLCFALQSTYPQLLTTMFLGQNLPDTNTGELFISPINTCALLKKPSQCHDVITGLQTEGSQNFDKS